jgi:hypothetical protein
MLQWSQMLIVDFGLQPHVCCWHKSDVPSDIAKVRLRTISGHAGAAIVSTNELKGGLPGLQRRYAEI